MAEQDLERVLWGWMERALKKLLLPHHAQRVENSTGKKGTPDVEGCIAGRQFWVELKVVPRIRVDGSLSLPHYTNHQAYFAHKRWEVGGLSWILVRVGQQPDSRHYLIPGSDALDLFEVRDRFTEDYLEARSACSAGDPAPIVWLRCAKMS
jgi:hypothetical protein